MPIPRYFKEDDRIPVDLEFLEKVEKDDDSKKKKKKKKKKKRQKNEEDDDKKKEPAMPLSEKNELMDSLLTQYRGYTDPEVEVVQDPF